MVSKRILVVEKKTGFEFVKEKLDTDSERYKELKEVHEKHKDIVNRVVEILEQNNCSYDLVKEKDVDMVNYAVYNYLVMVGGDGTFLRGVKNVASQIVLGINSDITKSRGALMKYNANNFEASLERLIEGDIEYEVWDRLGVMINGKKLGYYALNEVYVGDDSIKKTSHLDIFVRNQYARVSGNGVIVATKKGSTGWYKSITKSSFDVDAIGYCLVLPFSIKGDIEERKVLGLYDEVKVVPKREGYSLSFDCDYSRDVELNQEDEVIIKIDKSKGVNVLI